MIEQPNRTEKSSNGVRILSGKDLAQKLRTKLTEEIKQILDQGGRKPKLVVLQVGDNPASHVYIRNKRKACADVGMDFEWIHLSESESEDCLLQKVRQLNENPTVDGILCQLPLPAHMDPQKVIETIREDKDVDGFHPQNQGKVLLNDSSAFISCTPMGILRLLQEEHIKLEGKLALVIGRSNIVGKPMGQLLLQQNATVIQAHSKTQNLPELCKKADLIVVAAGSANLLRADWIHEGTVLVDVGMNRNAEGKLCGDAEPEAYLKCAAYTPVPGGVGPMTIWGLLQNTWKAYQLHQQKQKGLEEQIQLYLQKNNLTLSLAESCTGGLASAFLTKLPGISAVYQGSAVVYTEKSKAGVLNVSPLILKEEGAVSAACARELARKARTLFRTDLALSVTGYAGPQVSSEEVGLIYIALCAENKEEVEELHLQGSRRCIQEQAVQALWRLLERSLMHA